MAVEMLVAWVAAPFILAALCTGCGLAISRAVGVPLVLVPGMGFSALVVAGQFTAYLDATAELTTPLLAALPLAGLWLGRSWLPPARTAFWPLVAAGLVFAVYAAPIVASGEATFAGYIKLDDTATWLAFTDHVMEHGRDLDMLEPSSYEATLAINLGEGYPIGVFVPLGVVAALLGQDPAWLIQPYMAFGAVLLALGLFALSRGVLGAARPAALVAVVAAQPALLYGYYLWGGIKEVAAAALVATLAALLASNVAEGRILSPPECKSGPRCARWAPGAPGAVVRGAPRAFAPGGVAVLALVSGALVGVLSPGGLAWALPALLAGLVLAVRSLGAAAALRRAALFAALLAVCSVPVLAAGAIAPPTSSPLTDDGARGNLAEPLDPLQLAGIWPSGDFRFEPADLAAAQLLAALVATLALAGVVWMWRQRHYAPLAYTLGSLATAGALAIAGSPWVDGKVLATASPAVLFAAMLGATQLAQLAAFVRAETRGAGMRTDKSARVAGAAAALVVAGGVVWSNALAYLDVNLAPRGQLAELEEIGAMVAGEGPALMTEYQPYGVRHFLRDADPEGASELRRRRITLRSGGTLAKGEWADTDEFTAAALAPFRTFVLRRSPEQSRPPGEYERVWAGEFYEVWQRPNNPAAHRTSLAASYGGSSATFDGGGASARAGAPLFADRGELEAPEAWPRREGRPVPVSGGTLGATVSVPRAGPYRLWLRGSARTPLQTLVDGRGIGAIEPLLNNRGLYVELGTAELSAGPHRVEIRFAGASLRPGSDGMAEPTGPISMVREGR